MNKTLIVIVGPTAIGKTSLAIALANHFHTSIISADSRQFYIEMNIGTAKPSAEELEAARHYFINSHHITDNFNVGDFEREGLLVINEIFEQNDVAILVGGSGLYVDAICKGFDNLPETDQNLRGELNSLFETQGIEALQRELQLKDPEYFRQVDVHNPHRMIRALEVIRSTGQTFSSFRTNNSNKRPFEIIKIGLNTDREILYNQINFRVDLMVRDGLIDEVKHLVQQRNLNALNTVGYTELFDYLDGNHSLEKAIELIKQNTRRFAKRQLTWFKRDPSITWFNPEDDQDIIDYLQSKF